MEKKWELVLDDAFDNDSLGLGVQVFSAATNVMSAEIYEGDGIDEINLKVNEICRDLNLTDAERADLCNDLTQLLHIQVQLS